MKQSLVPSDIPRPIPANQLGGDISLAISSYKPGCHSISDIAPALPALRRASKQFEHSKMTQKSKNRCVSMPVFSMNEIHQLDKAINNKSNHNKDIKQSSPTNNLQELCSESTISIQSTSTYPPNIQNTNKKALRSNLEFPKSINKPRRTVTESIMSKNLPPTPIESGKSITGCEQANSVSRPFDINGSAIKEEFKSPMASLLQSSQACRKEGLKSVQQQNFPPTYNHDSSSNCPYICVPSTSSNTHYNSMDQFIMAHPNISQTSQFDNSIPNSFQKGVVIQKNCADGDDVDDGNDGDNERSLHSNISVHSKSTHIIVDNDNDVFNQLLEGNNHSNTPLSSSDGFSSSDDFSSCLTQFSSAYGSAHSTAYTNYESSCSNSNLKDVIFNHNNNYTSNFDNDNEVSKVAASPININHNSDQNVLDIPNNTFGNSYDPDTIIQSYLELTPNQSSENLVEKYSSVTASSYSSSLIDMFGSESKEYNTDSSNDCNADEPTTCLAPAVALSRELSVLSSKDSTFITPPTSSKIEKVESKHEDSSEKDQPLSQIKSIKSPSGVSLQNSTSSVNYSPAFEKDSNSSKIEDNSNNSQHKLDFGKASDNQGKSCHSTPSLNVTKIRKVITLEDSNNDHVNNFASFNKPERNSISSLKDIIKNIKHNVRQRPFSYCLENENSYKEYTRYFTPVEKKKVRGVSMGNYDTYYKYKSTNKDPTNSLNKKAKDSTRSVSMQDLHKPLPSSTKRPDPKVRLPPKVDVGFRENRFQRRYVSNFS